MLFSCSELPKQSRQECDEQQSQKWTVTEDRLDGVTGLWPLNASYAASDCTNDEPQALLAQQSKGDGIGTSEGTKVWRPERRSCDQRPQCGIYMSEV